MSNWNYHWVVLGKLLAITTIVYEGFAMFQEYVLHDPSFPTFSRMIAYLVPQPYLDIGTIIIALFLIWHWHNIEKSKVGHRK